MSITLGKETTVLYGKVTGGVIVLNDTTAGLPEGTAVTVILSSQELPAAMGQEFVAWDQAGADAWKMITEWEREEGVAPETLA